MNVVRVASPVGTVQLLSKFVILFVAACVPSHAPTLRLPQTPVSKRFGKLVQVVAGGRVPQGAERYAVELRIGDQNQPLGPRREAFEDRSQEALEERPRNPLPGFGVALLDQRVNAFAELSLRREEHEVQVPTGEEMSSGPLICGYFFSSSSWGLMGPTILDPGAVCHFDLGALCYGIVLAAWDRGLGSVINGQGIMRSDIVREVADIPEDQAIMTCVAMGYPDEDFAANAVRSDRREHEDFVRYVGFAD